MTNQMQQHEDPAAGTNRLAAMVHKAAEHMEAAGSKRFAGKADRLAVLTRLAVEKNDTLLKCSPQSLFWAYLDAARCGLEWDGNEGALVPFWNSKLGQNEARFMPMVRGLMRLLVESGAVISIDAVPVYEGEPFQVHRGLAPDIKHTVRMDVDRSDEKLIAAYAVFWLPNGSPRFSVMSREEIDKRRAVSQTGKKGWGPWKDWYAEMAVKTVVRAGFKQIPTLPPSVTTAYRVDSRPLDAMTLSQASMVDVKAPALEAPKPKPGALEMLEDLAAKSPVEDPPAPKSKPKPKRFSITPKAQRAAVKTFCTTLSKAEDVEAYDAVMAEQPADLKDNALAAVSAWTFYMARVLAEPEADNKAGLPEETLLQLDAVETLIAEA